MKMRYMVGIRVGRKSSGVTTEADDALIAALKVKQEHPDAMITYVRKQNVRADRRNPHPDVSQAAERH
jgi:hypothetical protein